MTLPPEDRDLIERVLGYDADENVKTLLLTRSDLSNLLAAARAEAAPVVSAPSSPGDGWEPIETAPRDGTLIDVFSTYRTVDAYWGKPEHSCGEAGMYCDSCPTEDGWVDSTFMTYIKDVEFWRRPPAAPSPGGDHG